MAINFRPHVKLNTNQQKDEPIKLKFNYGFGGEDEQEPDTYRNYYPLAESFRVYLTRFTNARQTRIEQRSFEVPIHIEYIQILFQSQFNISKFYDQWYNEFGLLGVHFSRFNNQILFAISDFDKFRNFIKNINDFVSKESGENQATEYSSKVLFVKDFKLLTTEEILQYTEIGALMNFRLVNDFPLGKEVYQSIFSSLESYLHENNIVYTYDEDANNLEVINADGNNIIEIVRNFDIVLNVTSSLATVIRPTEFNLPERTYGFEVGGEEGLPIIGIIDTGVSNQTPLAPILVNDYSFNLTSTDVFTDNANHGTAVAALAALGKKAYLSGYRGRIKADARILSIKIMDSDSSFLSQKSVLQLLRTAKEKYSSIKVFVLTICYSNHKQTNEDYSTYAYELDKFSHDNDCIITICTANNDNACNHNSSYDLGYFNNEATNLCAPAESMNNLTVGAAADCLRGNVFEGISTSKEFPTLYSRKGHLDLVGAFPRNKVNKLYFKPDVIESGGDYEYGENSNFIGMGSRASLELLSANPEESFYNHVGTSFSAHLSLMSLPKYKATILAFELSLSRH